MFLARKVFDFFYRFLRLAKVIFQRNNIKIILPNQDVRFISGSVKFKYPENIMLGSCVRVGDGVTFGALEPIEIGNNVTISQEVIIETAGLTRKGGRHSGRPIKIGDGVWIGSRAIILGGVTIGDNATIGAGVVLKKDVASGEVVK